MASKFEQQKVMLRKHRKGSPSPPVRRRRYSRRSMHPQHMRPVTIVMEEELNNLVKIRNRSRTMKETSRKPFGKQVSLQT